MFSDERIAIWFTKWVWGGADMIGTVSFINTIVGVYFFTDMMQLEEVNSRQGWASLLFAIGLAIGLQILITTLVRGGLRHKPWYWTVGAVFFFVIDWYTDFMGFMLLSSQISDVRHVLGQQFFTWMTGKGPGGFFDIANVVVVMGFSLLATMSEPVLAILEDNYEAKKRREKKRKEKKQRELLGAHQGMALPQGPYTQQGQPPGGIYQAGPYPPPRNSPPQE